MSSSSEGAVPASVSRLLTALVRPEALLAFPLLFGLALRLRKAWADIPSVIASIPDDAFYYFEIARNIANGRNVTFDGETLTNGFHPLWVVFLTPLYWITDDPDLAVHLAFTIAALLGVGTALLVFAIVRTLTGNAWAGLAGATFYALHPQIIIESINGMETALTVFFVALTIWLFVRIVCGEERTSWASYTWLGASGGLMVLSRTDTAFILPPVLLFVLVRGRFWEFFRDRSLRVWAGPVVAGGAALLVVTPWLVWTLVSFGTVVQVSGLAGSEFDREAFLAANGSSLTTQLERAWDVTSNTFFTQLPNLYFVPRGASTTLVLFVAGAVLVTMLLAPFARQRGQVTKQIGLLLIPTLGVAAALLFHSAIRWHVREWYLAPAGVIGAALFGVTVSYAHSVLLRTCVAWRSRSTAGGADSAGVEQQGAPSPAQAWRGAAMASLYGVVLLLLIGVYGPQRSEDWVRRLPHRENMLETALWIADNTDPEGSVGSFNAGIIGYFSERTVVNLDGVVNEDAFHARQDGRLGEYIREREIRYLADFPGSLFFAGCREVPPLVCTRLTTVGTKLGYFGGAQLDVLEVITDTS